MFAWVSASLAAASLSLGGVASAAEPQAALVSTRGVDLGDAGARAALERRIDQAAARACGVDPSASAEARHQQNLCLIATGNAARARLKLIEARRQVRLAGL
jgi:UrcA family protein